MSALRHAGTESGAGANPLAPYLPRLVVDWISEGPRQLYGGVSAQHPRLFRVRGAVLVRLGDHDGALAALEESVRTAAARGADYGLALTLRVLARLDERAGTRSHPEAQAQSAAILDRLDVVWTPELV